MSHTAELEIIRCIQELRNPVLDTFFTFLDFFDKQEFFFVLIPAVWLIKGWKWGLRLFYILFLSSFINHVLKEFFLSPRPFYLDGHVGVIQVKGYGFPSGAAQTVILLSGILLTFWNSAWKWSVVGSYVVFVSFSRVYLGVHFPTDILAGWLVGGALWALFVYVYPILEAQLQRLRPIVLFVLSQVLPICLFLLQYLPQIMRISVCAMGMGIGLFINYLCGWSLLPVTTKKESLLRLAIGVFGTFFCYFCMSFLSLPPVCTFLFLGLWITTGSLLVCRYTTAAVGENFLS